MRRFLQAAALGAAGAALAAEPAPQRIEITAPGLRDEVAGARAGPARLAPRKASTSDTAALLQDLPGVSLQGAGGVSGLPILNGLGDDRIRTQVDGMDLVAACPNHMNSPLSYLDAAQVASIRVYAGVAPVSVGGDSIGGTIQVDAAEPAFAPDATALVDGRARLFVRSNGRARGGSAVASIATDTLVLGYGGHRAAQANHRAARAFKPAAPGTEGGPEIPGDEVASTAYEAQNHELSLAWRHGVHRLLLKAGHQDIGFEGYPNQRMDMTGNRSTQLNLRWDARFESVALEARAWQQKVAHEMDMGPDRYRYGFGMPMDTEATTRGASLQGTLALEGGALLRAGAESLAHTLYDWWPAVGGAMGPNAFWNIDFGRRDRRGAYFEWESAADAPWFVQAGARVDEVRSDAGPVQGYDNGLDAIWGHEAAAFNALDRRRRDRHLDLAALLRHRVADTATLEAGLARKTRSPSLYQRYPWSTQPMAALMNNMSGDGNGYIGNPELEPELAHTLVLGAEAHDAAREAWSLKATLNLTHVDDYIDARRCDFGQCNAANTTATRSFVLLQYVNQRAQLRSLDLAGQWRLASDEAVGDLGASLVLKLLRGRNLDTGDGLYNLMPANAKLALHQRLGGWSASAEWVLVAAKDRVSAVRNEMRTPGYALAHLRAAWEAGPLRLDIAVENLFDRFHALPLGGAYLGQGRSMTSAGIPWGTPVPGIGRSLQAAVQLQF